jgi:hypothetical protein
MGAALPLRRGNAESLVAYVVSRQEPAGWAWMKHESRPTAFVLGVEVTQAVADPDPVVVTFVQPASPGELRPELQTDDLEAPLQVGSLPE